MFLRQVLGTNQIWDQWDLVSKRGVNEVKTHAKNPLFVQDMTEFHRNAFNPTHNYMVMNKIIPIVAIVVIVAVVAVIAASSTGGISSINYASMSCDELKEEVWAVASYTATTEGEGRDQQNQLKLIGEIIEDKGCLLSAAERNYRSMSCDELIEATRAIADKPGTGGIDDYRQQGWINEALEAKGCY